MIWSMPRDRPWVQQCMTSNLRSWYWHIVSLVNPWFFLFTSSVFSYWSSSAQQPAHQFNQRMAGVSCQIMSVWFLCPMEMNSSSTTKPRWGGVVLGCGCSYWLVLCVLCTVLMGCYTSNPTAVWPWSSHTLTLRSTQQQGCGNQCQIFFPPPAEWHSFSALKQEAVPNIPTECEFDRAHIVARKQSFSLCSVSAGLKNHKSKSSFL